MTLSIGAKLKLGYYDRDNSMGGWQRDRLDMASHDYGENVIVTAVTEK